MGHYKELLTPKQGLRTTVLDTDSLYPRTASRKKKSPAVLGMFLKAVDRMKGSKAVIQNALCRHSSSDRAAFSVICLCLPPSFISEIPWLQGTSKAELDLSKKITAKRGNHCMMMIKCGHPNRNLNIKKTERRVLFFSSMCVLYKFQQKAHYLGFHTHLQTE